MTIAQDIISCRMPDFDVYLRAGESLDDIDEFGFTPLIEAAITQQVEIAQALLERGVDPNKADVTGRTALHWAVDNQDLVLAKLLLSSGADPNAFTRNGLSVLVYPVLRSQNELKHLLYQYGAKLDFALDFINAKLLGHRFELKGSVDIANAANEFIELDYEGFILEFTVAIMNDALRRFTSSFSTKRFRHHFSALYSIMDAFMVAAELLRMQHHVPLRDVDRQRLSSLSRLPTLILPAASQGHAMCFVYHEQWWAKIDRGENSLKEGSVNIYKITQPEAYTASFLETFLYQKQPRKYFHQAINQQLGLKPYLKIPISSQIVGNCSWANVQAIVPVAYALQQLVAEGTVDLEEVMSLYDTWMEWDQDRALDECVQRFYVVDEIRKASYASMLAAVLFQACDDDNDTDVVRAEKLMPILQLPEYHYILQSYLEIYCVRRLTRKGNNLLKLLEDCGINPNIGVNPVATGLDDQA